MIGRNIINSLWGYTRIFLSVVDYNCKSLVLDNPTFYNHVNQNSWVLIGSQNILLFIASQWLAKSVTKAIFSAAGANTWAEKKTAYKVTHLNSQTDQSEDREPNGDKNNRFMQ